MTRKRFQQLSEGYLEGTLSAAEWQELKSYLLEDGNHAEFESELMAALEQKDYDSTDRAVLGRILKNVSAQKDRLTPPVHRIHFLKTTWFRYAAAIVILVGVGTYLWINKPDTKNLATTSGNKRSQPNIGPGSNRAVLTLSDGSTIVLDSAADGELAVQYGRKVIKKNGEVIYDPNQISVKNVVYNTISTPRGGQYKLTLADGTKVWLNAATSITYPVAFAGKERNVTISGEAYFEVSKDKQKPFIVDIGGKSTVQVLGTIFNINSYEDEGSIKTTLLEGSIKLTRGAMKSATMPAEQLQNSVVVLQPGQQAQISTKGIAVASNADIDQALAWKNGLFNFDNAGVKEVMKQLERWYDINVEYPSGVPDLQFGGEISRNLSLADVLEILERTKVHLRLEEGRKLVVTK
ncbi:MAG TPA: FecR domain-containing protein [Flavitalea sp.]|nr:FecR domain-containing protein [Flavitalea sp.]